MFSTLVFAKIAFNLRFASAKSVVSLSAVLATPPTTAIPAPTQKAIRQLTSNLVAT